MTFVRAAQSDVPEIIAFLQERSEYVMFPLNNLVQCGLDGDDDLAPRMWRNASGPITDVLSITKAGMILPFLPSGDFEAAAQALHGRNIIGVIGPAPHARGMQAALNLTKAAMELDADEAHFALDLSDLQIPDGKTQIVPLSENHRTVLTEWMIDYHITALGMAAETAAQVVPERITREISEDRRVVLLDAQTPVATTAFNANLPDIVQVGGVYTPAHLRGHGHARRAVALHLAQARNRGARKATLFADSPSAIAAYRSVGFDQIGDWVLAILKTPQVAQ